MSTSSKYFLYFMHQKGDKLKEDTPVKVGVSNNVKADRLMFEEGKNADLKTHKVVKTKNGDSNVFLEEFKAKYAAKHLSRNWFSLTKQELDAELADLAKRDGCSMVSESKAVRTPEKPKESKKLSK